jgi:hypothetical protein
MSNSFRKRKIDTRSEELSEKLAGVLNQDILNRSHKETMDSIRLIHARALFTLICLVTGQEKTPDELLREIEEGQFRA